MALLQCLSCPPLPQRPVKVCRLKPLLKIAFQEHHEDALGVKVKAHLGACSSDYLTSCHENKANC